MKGSKWTTNHLYNIGNVIQGKYTWDPIRRYFVDLLQLSKRLQSG
jgi:hypothetical protein